MDKPYTERTGGSYVRDKESGTIRRAGEARSEKPAEPAKPEVDNKKKGK